MRTAGATQSLDQFRAGLADFNRRADLHKHALLRFLAASPHGEPHLARELARRGISRPAFERSLTINIKAEPIAEAA